MFCRKSKKKKNEKKQQEEETARAVSWRPIEDTPVTWPANGLEIALQSTEEHLIRAAASVTAFAEVVSVADCQLQTVVETHHEKEIPIIVEELAPGNVDSNDDGSNNKVDDNANHINIQKPRISDAPSGEFRSSTASLLSTNSNGTRISGNMPLLRRFAYRDDDEEENEQMELVLHEISTQEEEIIRKALEANDFITAVAKYSLKELPKYMTRIDVKAGEIIMNQGENGDSMYVSKNGSFEVRMDKKTISKFKDCRLFGELAILYNKPRVATVIAVTDGTLWQLQRNIFKNILRKSNAHDNDLVLEFLRKVPIINEASDNKLQLIASLCERRYYDKDTVIIREGKKGDEFYIVKSGTAIVTKAGQGKLKQYSAGDFFGERALLNEDKRKATVTAGSYGVDCLILNRHEFITYLGDVTKFLAQAEETQDEDPIPLEASDEQRFAKYADITLNDLKKIRKLGEGGFGLVYLVKNSKGKQFALKELAIDKVKKANVVANAYNERDIQKACDSIFIVQLYRTFKDSTSLYFLLEFCPRAELFTLLRKKKHFSEGISRFVASCVLEALIYLHRRSVAYLDLKPENIMIDRDGYPKLADFGNAMIFKPGEKTYVFAGTPEYMAPEIYEHKGTDRAADWWAFGVLIYEMLMGKSPFANNNEQLMVKNITKGIIGKHFPEGFNKSARELIRGLMHLTPIKRLGCLRPKQLRKHDWFKDMDFVQLEKKGLRSPLLSLYKK